MSNIIITAENYEQVRRETLQKAYSTATNTLGHYGFVVEARESRLRAESAWEPLHAYGLLMFGSTVLPYSNLWSNIEYSLEQCTLMIYEDGKSAAETMNHLKTACYWKSYRVKRYMLPQAAAEIVEAKHTWKAREAARFTDGTYTPLPFAEEPWFKERHEKLCHYAHVSVEDKGKIAYTRDNSQGQRNIKTRVSVGRYLREFFNEQLSAMGPKETGATNVLGEKTKVDALQWYVRNFNNQYGGGSELLFAKTRQEMYEVYTAGPNSCMSYDVGDYSTDGVHPVEVYAAGDLQVAYLKDEDGNITSRALVWPEEMAVGRIYGDYIALRTALAENGYGKDDPESLRGARLLKIPHGKGHVMPFIDGCGNYGYDADKNFFIIGGPRCATYTNGLDYDNEHDCNCERCGEGVNEDDIYSVIVSRSGDSGNWCSYCFEDYSFECATSSARYSTTIPHIVLDSGEYVARCNLDGDYFQCHVTRSWFHIDDAAGEFENSGETVSMQAVENEELLQDDEGRYWEPANFPGNEDAEEEAA